MWFADQCWWWPCPDKCATSSVMINGQVSYRSWTWLQELKHKICHPQNALPQNSVTNPFWASLKQSTRNTQNDFHQPCILFLWVLLLNHFTSPTSPWPSSIFGEAASWGFVGVSTRTCGVAAVFPSRKGSVYNWDIGAWQLPSMISIQSNCIDASSICHAV